MYVNVGIFFNYSPPRAQREKGIRRKWYISRRSTVNYRLISCTAHQRRAQYDTTIMMLTLCTKKNEVSCTTKRNFLCSHFLYSYLSTVLPTLLERYISFFIGLGLIVLTHFLICYALFYSSLLFSSLIRTQS